MTTYQLQEFIIAFVLTACVWLLWKMEQKGNDDF